MDLDELKEGVAAAAHLEGPVLGLCLNNIHDMFDTLTAFKQTANLF